MRLGSRAAARAATQPPSVEQWPSAASSGDDRATCEGRGALVSMCKEGWARAASSRFEGRGDAPSDAPMRGHVLPLCCRRQAASSQSRSCPRRRHPSVDGGGADGSLTHMPQRRSARRAPICFTLGANGQDSGVPASSYQTTDEEGVGKLEDAGLQCHLQPGTLRVWLMR